MRIARFHLGYIIVGITTRAKFREHGWFDITANVNRTTGNVTWRAQ